MIKFDLSNRIAIVTGGAQGFGLAITERFIEAGAKVVIWDIDEDAAKKATDKVNSENLSYQIVDVSSFEIINKNLSEVESKYGKIDIFINNAGIAESADIKLDLNNWSKMFDKTIDVNLKAPSLIFKEFLKYKREKKIKSRLRFINISSRAAFRGEQQDYISYACSKGGLISLTKTMSRSFGETDNIVAISIAPGFVRTEMAQSFIDKHGEDVVKHGITLDRLTEPKDISPIVSLIVSGKMDHSTGSTIDVNGGSFLR